MSDWKKNTKDETEIDLWRFVEVFLKRFWIILLTVCVFAASGFVYTKLQVKPLYRTQFTAYVKNRIPMDMPTTDTGTGTTNTSDLNASIGLMYLYNEIISSRTVLTEAAKDVGLDYGYGTLKGMVSTELPEKAALIKVYVTAVDPKVAMNLANAIARRAAERGKIIEDNSSMEVVDYPVATTRLYSISRNVLIAAVMGGILSYVFFVILDLVNDRVTDAEDLENRYNVVVVGRIPDMAHFGRAYRYKYKYSYRRYHYGKGYGEQK